MSIRNFIISVFVVGVMDLIIIACYRKSIDVFFKYFTRFAIGLFIAGLLITVGFIEFATVDKKIVETE